MSRSDQLRALVLEMSGEQDFQIALLTALGEIAGYELADIAWFAAALAERSPDHAAQVVELVVRLSGEARKDRAHRRIEQRIAALSAAHSPPSGWEQPVLDAATAQERRSSLWRRLWLRIVRRR